MGAWHRPEIHAEYGDSSLQSEAAAAAAAANALKKQCLVSLQHVKLNSCLSVCELVYTDRGRTGSGHHNWHASWLNAFQTGV